MTYLAFEHWVSHRNTALQAAGRSDAEVGMWAVASGRKRRACSAADQVAGMLFGSRPVQVTDGLERPELVEHERHRGDQSDDDQLRPVEAGPETGRVVEDGRRQGQRRSGV